MSALTQAGGHAPVFLGQAVRWFVWHVGLYFLVGMAGALAFLVGSGIYVALVPAPAEQLETVPGSPSLPVIEPSQQPQPRNNSALIAGAQAFQAGAAVYAGDQEIGTVEEVLYGADGAVRYVVVFTNKEQVGTEASIPVPVEFVQATQAFPHSLTLSASLADWTAGASFGSLYSEEARAEHVKELDAPLPPDLESDRPTEEKPRGMWYDPENVSPRLQRLPQ